MRSILEVEGLNKSFKDFSINNISFTIPEGCITGFIGVNGAGKTTTIRTILGLGKKESGEIRIFGKNLESNEQELKNRIGVVLDEGCFYEDLTINEMKSIIAPAYSEWSDKDFNEYMQKFSLDSHQKISTLSKGMRMKFALAIALSHNADLLIMDEPTSGLDPLIRSQLLEIIYDYMKQGGKAVFFSTHITSDLDKIADLLILIHGGKILLEQEKDTMLDSYRMVKGDSRALNDVNRKLFLRINETEFGFTGVTNKFSEVQKSIENILSERPTIEDIMLAHIEGRQK